MSRIERMLNPDGHDQPFPVHAGNLYAQAIVAAGPDIPAHEAADQSAPVMTREEFDDAAERDTLLRLDNVFGLSYTKACLAASVEATGQPVMVLRALEGSDTVGARRDPKLISSLAGHLTFVLTDNDRRVEISDLRAGKYSMLATSTLPNDLPAVEEAYNSYTPSENPRAIEWKSEDGRFAYLRAQLHATDALEVEADGSLLKVDISAGVIDLNNQTYREIELR